MINRPEVFPEEYAQGYLGRIMALNGLSDFKAAVRLLMDRFGPSGASARDFPLVELLATVAGIETAQFVRSHTTLPLRRAIVRQPLWPHGSTQQKSVLWAVSLREVRPGAYFCVKCVEEDRDFHGMTYWRREHQLPGHYSCEKHRHSLGYVEGTGAFLFPPSAFHAHHHRLDDLWVKQLDCSAPVQRFRAICADLLAKPSPLAERDVSRTAKLRGVELGLQTSRGVVDRPLVSDLIKDQFDRQWLASVMPGLEDKTKGQRWMAVDAALSGKGDGVTSTAYALVFAALFDSPASAVDAMLVRSPACTNQPRPIDVDHQFSDQQIVEAYLKGQASHSSALQLLGVPLGGTNESVVRRRFSRLGIPNIADPARAKSVCDAIAAVVLHGQSIRAACQRTGADPEFIEKLIVRSVGSLRVALAETGRFARPIRRTERRKPSAPPRMREVHHSSLEGDPDGTSKASTPHQNFA